MTPELRRDLLVALERPHRLGTIGGDLEEQLAHCAGFSSVLAQTIGAERETEGLRGIDLGTGGGLPGVALAALWPHMRWTLVDMRTARADEVERTVLRLGLADRVDVRGIEAQHLGHQRESRESYDVAVARAFGPSSLTAECGAGLVGPGGHLIVSEPPASGEDHDRWPASRLGVLGFAPASYIVEGGRRFVVLRKVGEAPPNIPRLPPRSNRGWVKSSR